MKIPRANYTPMLATFKPPRERDAWFTIRGYVYQVDFTIARWLCLSAHEVLHLEAGEDIDRVTQALASGAELRLLEQIKYRDTSITLRSEEAIEAIANAVENRQSNPTVTLQVCFTTNANPGRERLSTLPKGATGIETWEKIRQGAITGEALDQALGSISPLLQNARKPNDLNDDTWRAFTSFILAATSGDILALIRSFAWSTQNPDAGKISDHILSTLQAQGHAADAQQAQEQYDRLFLHVFKVLSQRGLKHLTPEGCQELLTLPVLSAADRLLLVKIKGVIAEIEERVTLLEEQATQQTKTLELVDAELRRLAFAQGIDAAVSYTVVTPAMDVPPAVELGSERKETVARVAAEILQHSWVALYGGAGIGKTQLSILVARQLGCRLWLSFRDLTVEQACQRLDAACTALTNSALGPGLQRGYETLSAQLGTGSLIVLDDLPQMTAGDPLVSRLTLLARAFASHGLHILSTSTYYVPSVLREIVGRDILHTITEFPLSDTETKEILQAYGAPADCPSFKAASFINSIAHNHPALVVAITLYLRQRDWALQDATLGGLFAGEYAGELNDETIKRLLDTVEDQASHELLYRLNLPFGSFVFELVQRLAAVLPEVQRPREKLNALVGLWVQRQASGEMSVSPLIKAIGSSELTVPTRTACYRTLGDYIAEKRLLTPFDIANAVSYYVQSDEYARAGTLLHLGLSEMHEHEITDDPAGLTSLWWNIPLPEQMDLNLRLYLRCKQIAVGQQMGRPLSSMIADMLSLIDQAGPEQALGVLVTGMLISNLVAEVDYRSACRLVLRQVQLAQAAVLPDGQPLRLPRDISPETAVWFLVGSIDSRQKLFAWMQMVEQFTPEQRARAFAGRIAEGGCKHLVDHYWMAEARKPAEQRKWEDVASSLFELAARARTIGQELLWAASVRGIIVVRAEYQKDLEAALGVATSTIETTEDVRSRFLIAECIGRDFAYAGQIDQAKTWLNCALACDTDAFPFDRAIVLMEIERIVGRDDPAGALVYAQQAVEIAENHTTEFPTLETTKLSGELAIARWLVGDKSGAFEAWETVVSDLLETKDDTRAWKSLWVVVGHITGYLTSMATMGIPPVHTQDGIPYVAPERGMLLQPKSIAADHYDGTRDSVMVALMANFAEVVGKDERASEWALKAVETARETGQPMALAAVERNAVAHLIADDRYAEALGISLEVAAVIVAAKRQYEGGSEPFSDDGEPEAILGATPNEHWRLVENIAARTTLIPALLRVGTLAINHPELAVQRASELSGLCRQISATAANRTLWTTAAEVIEAMRDRQSTARALFTKSQQLTEEDERPLRVFTLLGATLFRDATLRDAIVAQLMTLPDLAQWFDVHPSMSRRVLTPFVEAYWTNALRHKRLLFAVPQLFERFLNEAKAAPVAHRTQSILEAVRLSVGVDVSDDIMNWLKSGERPLQ